MGQYKIRLLNRFLIRKIAIKPIKIIQNFMKKINIVQI